jgi:hypothetical protein
MTSSQQSPIARLAEFADNVKTGKGEALFVCFVYVAFLCMALVMWHHYSDQDFSFIITFAGLTQTAAFYLLLHKMKVERSAAGISSKTLQTYVLALCFRLSSTCVKNGYLPVDRSGDHLYQATDIASVLLLFQMLFFCHKRYADTYQEDLDTFPIFKLIPACILLGLTVHGKLNHSPFFDKTWTIGMWCDSIAMLPQLWMLVSKGGKVEALTANFVALIFLSRLMTWFFWFSGYDELAPKEGGKFTGGFNKVGALIMTGQSLSLVVSGDFMYHYFKWQSANFCSLFCRRSGSAETDRKSVDGMVLPSLSAEMEV